MADDLAKDTVPLYSDTDPQPTAPQPEITPIPPPPNEAVYNPAQPPAYTAEPAPPAAKETTYTAAPGAVHPFPKKADMQSYQPLAPEQHPGYPPQHQQGYPPQMYPSQAYPPQAYPMSTQQSTSNVTVVTSQPTIQVLDPGAKPENYLILSVFACICCCWLLGIIAIIYSLQVDSSWAAGDYEGARRSSRTALYWNIATIVVGLVVGVVGGIISGINRANSTE